jgi:hypothetical protein
MYFLETTLIGLFLASVLSSFRPVSHQGSAPNGSMSWPESHALEMYTREYVSKLSQDTALFCRCLAWIRTISMVDTLLSAMSTVSERANPPWSPM